MRSFLAAALVLLPLSGAVTEEELESFLYSPSGLSMMRSDAHSLAMKEAPILTECRVSISDLKALKEALYNPRLLDFSMQEVRLQLLPLAEQHVNPDEIKQLHDVLYDTKSLDMMKSDAKKAALQLLKFHAEPDQIKNLFDALRGMQLSKAAAQVKAVNLADAGCDPVALKNSYAASKNFDAAVKSAVRANLNGQAKRYAKDGVAYNVADFQAHYGDTYLSEWMGAPSLQRVANDGKAYTASEFRVYFGASWEQKWDAAHEATQRRIAADGKTYTVAEFVLYYKDDWQRRWFEAPEVPCEECSGADGLLVV